MESALKGLFGGGESNDDTSAAHDFVQRVTTGDPSQGYTNEEAQAAASHVLQHAPPDVVNRAMEKSMSNLSEDQRGQFAQMLQQRSAQGRPTDAGVSSGSGPTIQHSSGSSDSGGSEGGLGGMLGGLLGGSGGGGNSGGLLGGSGGSNSGGGLGGMLGGLLGGGAQSQSQSGTVQQGGGGNVLSDVMNNPIGKVAMAGMAAYAMKEILGK